MNIKLNYLLIIKKIKEVRKEIIYVKNDLIDNTYTSNKKFHEWINKFKKEIFPQREENILTYEEDIKINHNKYLKHMLKMNKHLEQVSGKLFSAISLRTSITDKYVHIDTSVLKDIFGEIGKNKISKTNLEIWNTYFNINNKKLKLKGHTFNFQISTDGLAASINFINNTKIEGKNKKIKLLANASKQTKELRKTKTEKEIEEIKRKEKEFKLEKLKETSNKKKEEIKIKKENFKKLPKEEQEKIKLQIKLEKNKFEYIEDAIKDPEMKKKLEEKYKKGLVKVIDPGMRSPMTILGKGLKTHKRGKIRKDKILFSYSTKNRILKTKRIKYGKMIINKKRKTKINKKSIEKIEAELSIYNSKTVNYKKFIEYANKKINLRKSISKYTHKIEQNKHKKNKMNRGIKYNEYVKKLNWFGYINKKRHEDELLNEIEKVYGSDAVFVIGDWGAKGRIKRISSPNMGMKKLLSKRFEVYLIDEYKTSKIHNKSEKEGKKLKIKIEYEKGNKKYKYTKEIHSVLTFQLGDKENECINRDYNACLNMFKIIDNIFKTSKRPEKYCRSSKNLDHLTDKDLKAPKSRKKVLACI